MKKYKEYVERVILEGGVLKLEAKQYGRRELAARIIAYVDNSVRRLGVETSKKHMRFMFGDKALLDKVNRMVKGDEIPKDMSIGDLRKAHRALFREGKDK